MWMECESNENDLINTRVIYWQGTIKSEAELEWAIEAEATQNV